MERTGERFWPTPGAADGKQHCSNPAMAKARADSGKQMGLETAVHLANWPTPSARDWKDSPGMAQEAQNKDGSRRNRTDQLARAVYAEGNMTTGALNPDWVEWLMGVPTGWTALDSWGTE